MLAVAEGVGRAGTTLGEDAACEGREEGRGERGDGEDGVVVREAAVGFEEAVAGEVPLQGGWRLFGTGVGTGVSRRVARGMRRDGRVWRGRAGWSCERESAVEQ